MKTLTKMKKVCCLSRFVLLVMALGMTSIFTSCSSDDDENIPVYSLKDVEGTYSGKMQTTSIAPLENAENEAEDGVTLIRQLSMIIKTTSYFKCHLNPWYWKSQWNHNP